MSTTNSNPSAPETKPDNPQGSQPKVVSMSPVQNATSPSRLSPPGVAASQPSQSAVAGPAVVSPRPVGLASAVNAAQGKSLPMPKGIKKGVTSDLKAPAYFHCMIYGETDARKTFTAATFGTPEQVRIIMTRRMEQLISLADTPYEYVTVEDADALEFAMLYPERIWPEWAQREDRVLVVDDITKAKDMLLDENSTITTAGGDEREIKDNRKVHVGAKKDMQTYMNSVLSKPQHVIVVALARTLNNSITSEEFIGPDLPPAMGNMLNTDFEFVFYIKKGSWKLLTQEDRITAKKLNEQGKEETFTRRIFAKNKLPKSLAAAGLGKTPLLKEESMDLMAIWNKVRQSK